MLANQTTSLSMHVFNNSMVSWDMTPDMTLLDVSVTPNQNKEKEKFSKHHILIKQKICYEMLQICKDLVHGKMVVYGI